jgi:cell wall-associated NlpC family hydrolase
MLHHDEEQFLQWVTPYTREIERDQLGPGDLIMWKFGRTYSHSAIVIDMPRVIHAVVADRRVIITDIDRDALLASRPSRYFTIEN